MIDAKEIDKEISRLEYEESSYPDYAKLADLYQIRDHMDDKTAALMRDLPAAYSYDPPQETAIVRHGESDFLSAIAGKDAERIWLIMDELMDTLRVVNHKAYRSVMREINEDF